MTDSAALNVVLARVETNSSKAARAVHSRAGAMFNAINVARQVAWSRAELSRH